MCNYSLLTPENIGLLKEFSAFDELVLVLKEDDPKPTNPEILEKDEHDQK